MSVDDEPVRAEEPRPPESPAEPPTPEPPESPTAPRKAKDETSADQDNLADESMAGAPWAGGSDHLAVTAGQDGLRRRDGQPDRRQDAREVGRRRRRRRPARQARRPRVGAGAALLAWLLRPTEVDELHEFTVAFATDVLNTPMLRARAVFHLSQWRHRHPDALVLRQLRDTI